MARGETKATTDHDRIREWVEQRDGRPATVRDTGDEESPGVLRIDFQGEDDDALEEISWNAFFEKFDREGLVFLHQDELKSGQTSRFFKFVDCDTAEDGADEWV